jgi:hypothetical protein
VVGVNPPVFGREQGGDLAHNLVRLFLEIGVAVLPFYRRQPERLAYVNGNVEALQPAQAFFDNPIFCSPNCKRYHRNP